MDLGLIPIRTDECQLAQVLIRFTSNKDHLPAAFTFQLPSVRGYSKAAQLRYDERPLNSTFRVVAVRPRSLYLTHFWLLALQTVILTVIYEAALAIEFHVQQCRLCLLLICPRQSKLQRSTQHPMNSQPNFVVTIFEVLAHNLNLPDCVPHRYCRVFSMIVSWCTFDRGLSITVDSLFHLRLQNRGILPFVISVVTCSSC